MSEILDGINVGECSGVVEDISVACLLAELRLNWFLLML